MAVVQEKDTVYSSPKFRDIDVGAIMRDGHPDIPFHSIPFHSIPFHSIPFHSIPFHSIPFHSIPFSDGDDFIVSTTRKLHSRLDRPLRIIDVGSGSGDLSLLLAKDLADSEIIANDVEPNPVVQAQEKLASFPHASVYDQPFESWEGTADVVISWGSHHHLSHDYLAHVKEILSPGGIFIVGDEFCPEYLLGADRERLAKASKIMIVDGYVFDNDADVTAFRERSVQPEWSARLEIARRHALWTWYKFVGDYAVSKGQWPVLIAELGIARDDLITEFDAEHKTSPYLLERELELNGFEVTEKKVIGEREPELLSFVVYVCRLEQANAV